jgi:hypothetical protein
MHNALAPSGLLPGTFIDPSLVDDHDAFDHYNMALLAIHQASAWHIDCMHNLVSMSVTSDHSILVYTYQSGACNIKHYKLVNTGKWPNIKSLRFTML